MSKNIKSNLKVLNKKTLVLLISLTFLLFTLPYSSIAQEKITISENLKITKVNEHSYIHISKITLENGGKFPCNGFVYINNNEAYIFDTPANDQATVELINWLKNDKKVIIKGVVFNHFHRDCIEGMDVFQKNNIPCIASKNTAMYMKLEGYDLPDQMFQDYLDLKLGDKKIINRYFGEAHTSDNIISYFPDEEVIFGGCMIKSIHASKGNLADANINEWSKTVTKIKKAYPNIEVVIPGHGDYGNRKLLDYTISLFKK
ncbi:subclass B1 metallo-beta-lactamase [Aquimarina sp. MMG016]|uniref:subclass B1 metallo-beta-lactamase n=1 Tax=Aquimarina sp. MMG016 TaxID=2822690 RepID=UPI001B3A3B5B|nr:subclass B1 metallo-beta-lactamase [Aquimarina sp. MMG016]MBQ4821120.1 subclass B1 metallo-beta-lactamase [Aquimarina sp. MMG016]